MPGKSSTSPSFSRVGRLNSETAVRREAARLYRDGRRGVIDAADASRLGSILGLIGRLVEAGDLEARLEALEKRVGDGDGDRRRLREAA